MKEFGRFFGELGIRCPGCPHELERKIAVPPLFVFIGMSYEDIEMLEGDIYVCPSDCGYFEYAEEKPLESWMIVEVEREPEPIEPRIVQVPLPLEFFAALPQPDIMRPYIRRRAKIIVITPFPASFNHLYSQFLLAELSAESRGRKG